jgi:hypothetical protein
VSYWAPEEGEDGRPPDCLPYRRSVVDEGELRAVYAHGDVDAVGEHGGSIELEMPELVTAAHDGRRTQPHFDPRAVLPSGGC